MYFLMCTFGQAWPISDVRRMTFPIPFPFGPFFESWKGIFPLFVSDIGTNLQ